MAWNWLICLVYDCSPLVISRWLSALTNVQFDECPHRQMFASPFIRLGSGSWWVCHCYFSIGQLYYTPRVPRVVFFSLVLTLWTIMSVVLFFAEESSQHVFLMVVTCAKWWLLLLFDILNVTLRSALSQCLCLLLSYSVLDCQGLVL